MQMVLQTFTKKDYESDQDLRWCPGCGDYSILDCVKDTLAKLKAPRHETAFISGIGCSSRLPYYMGTYGFHTIHGRAPAIATGLKLARPELDVWIITGDGDGLSIGGNHLLHLFRRNIDVTMLLFNNQVYGLTKGQHSPTAPQNKKNRTSAPDGTIDAPVNPLRFARGANASMLIRSIDFKKDHLKSMLERASEHRGAVFVEIYQDCNVFNKNAYKHLYDKQNSEESILYLEHGKPMVFGNEGEKKAIRMDGMQPVVFNLEFGNYGIDDALVHNELDESGTLADILINFQEQKGLPLPVGVIRNVERPCYEDGMETKIEEAKQKRGGDLQALFESSESSVTWEVE